MSDEQQQEQEQKKEKLQQDIDVLNNDEIKQGNPAQRLNRLLMDQKRIEELETKNKQLEEENKILKAQQQKSTQKESDVDKSKKA